MTDTTKLLALARAVYGEWAHVGPHYDIPANGPVVYTDIAVRIATDNGIDPFDPANNIEQAWAVLAWLLRNRRCDLSHNAVTVWHSNDILICDIDYDGTASGLRKAVTEAGMRVVG